MPSSAETVAQIHELVTAAYPADGPGVAVIAARDGEPWYRGARGLAHLELGVPLDPGMAFRIASLTKQFTAAAVLMLCDDGRIGLGDAIASHLPHAPSADPPVTIAHLLTHTAGIVNYTSLPEWAPQMRDEVTPDQLIARFERRPLEFAPGQRFAYSNSGYVLLGRLIERVAGVGYGDFLQQRIFSPLGMRASRYDDQRGLVPRLASGYGKAGDGFVPAAFMSQSQAYAAGALISSIDDLLRWDQALSDGRVLARETLQRACTSARLPDGSCTGYGYGWAVSELEGHPWIEHAGGISGYSSYAARFPADRIFVAVLANQCGEVDPKLLGVRIAKVLLGLRN